MTTTTANFIIRYTTKSGHTMTMDCEKTLESAINKCTIIAGRHNNITINYIPYQQLMP